MENKQCKSCKLYNSLGCPYSGCDWEENEECDEFIKEEEMNSDYGDRTMTKEQQIEEMSKFICNACEMGCGFDGECAVGQDGESYKTCRICKETAEKIFESGYRKSEEKQW